MRLSLRSLFRPIVTTALKYCLQDPVLESPLSSSFLFLCLSRAKEQAQGRGPEANS